MPLVFHCFLCIESSDQQGRNHNKYFYGSIHSVLQFSVMQSNAQTALKNEHSFPIQWWLASMWIRIRH